MASDRARDHAQWADHQWNIGDAKVDLAVIVRRIERRGFATKSELRKIEQLQLVIKTGKKL